MFRKLLLAPFSLLYGWVMFVRNRLYDVGMKPSASFSIPLISVGNLTVGGTGKSPLVEYIVRLLQASSRNTAILSRGYGRRSKGFRIAGPLDNGETIGDEPYQFYLKFPKTVVAVGEERALAIPTLLGEYPDTDVVILDDAYQHRKVRPRLSILLTDFNRPFFDDQLLPAGLLRESRTEAIRADLIIVTKCPDGMSDETMMEMEHRIREYSSKPVFFSKIKYGDPIPFGNRSAPLSGKVILVTGIANALPLRQYVQWFFTLAHHFEYRDHHHYTDKDMQAIQKQCNQTPGSVVLTTEKDMVKINCPILKKYVETLPLYFIPIETEFIKSGKDFDAMVLSSLNLS